MALEVAIRNALTGDEKHLEISWDSTLRQFQAALHAAFDIPPFEQILLHEDGDAVLGDSRFDDTRPIRSVPKLSSETPLLIARKLDTRPQAEKNCAFVEALREGKLDEAMNILDSSGVSVDPNCVGSFDAKGPGFLSGGRDFGDIRSAKTPALCMAVMARCTWSPKGAPTGELADEANIVGIVERLLSMGASLDQLQHEVHTCGSWPQEVVNKTPLYLAVQTRSPTLVRVLMDAGADPTHGCCECQFSPGKSMPCESALTSGRQWQAEPWDDTVTTELRSLLRRNEYEVRISCADPQASKIGIKVSRKDGYWGFIDKIDTDGLIAKWNRDQSDEGQVKLGDKIVAVCGHRAGISRYNGTGFLVDEVRGGNFESGAECFLAHLLVEPPNEMVLTITRTKFTSRL